MKKDEINHLFATIIDITKKPVFVTNRNGEIIFLNEACSDVFGTSHKDLRGQSYREIFPEETVRQMFFHDSRVLADCTEIDIETWIPFGTSRRFYTMTKTPYQNAAGETVGVIHRNISERDRNERILLAERKAMDDELRFITEAGTILSSSLDFQTTLAATIKIAVPHFSDFCSIAVLESDGTLRTMATSAENTSIAPSIILLEAVRKKTPLLFSKFAENYPEFMGCYNPCEIENGTPQLLGQLAPHSAIILPLIYRDTVLGVIQLFHSNSARQYGPKQLELAEKFGKRIGSALESALLYQASQKAVATRDEFISIASHELKTPITALKLQTQLIKASLNPDSKIQIPKDRLALLVNNSDQQIDRLSRLITDLFDVSGLNQGQLNLRYERFDLRELILEILDHFKVDLTVSGSTIDLDAPAPIIGNWDRVRMEQVVRNLIGNAIKYGRGRPIHISAWIEGGPQGLYRPVARMHIRDQGIGIDEENRNLIFERFKRGACGTNIQGLGLGLYIVRQILVAHGGHVHVQSEADQGSTFIIEVPVQAPAESPTSAPVVL